MKRLTIALSCIILAGWLLSSIIPGDRVEELKKRLYDYINEKPTTNLYLHLDKNNYAPSEDIWFKAYILSGIITDNKVLYVRLTDENKKTIIAQQFPVYDIRSHGDIFLPDTLKNGKYYLYAYTDRMINFSDKDIFVQEIQVRRNERKILEAQAIVVDTTRLKRGEEVELSVKVKENGSPAKNIKGEYQLISNEIVIRRGKLNTNDLGETSIKFTYPQMADDKSLRVKVNFNREKEVAEVSLNLKHEGNPVKVNLYPEGGHLIENVNNKIVIETFDIYKNPVSAELLIKNGQQSIARIRTNNHGIGVINFKPQKNVKYKIEISGNNKKDTLQFPEIIESKGYGLSIQGNKEGLEVTIVNKDKEENALLVLRSFNEVLWSKSVTVSSGDSLKVPIPANDFPKAVLSLSVFDPSGKPCAERLFLNKSPEEYKVDIKTDQQAYGVRKKVTVTVRITDPKGNPVIGNLSVSAAEKHRLNPATYSTILHSYYYKSLRDDNLNQFISNKSESDLDALLITKKWGDYQWENVLNYNAKGSVELLKNTDGVMGYIELLGKKSKKINELSVFSKAGIFTVKVDEQNKFSIPSSSLIAERSNKWYIIQDEEFEDKYKIHFTNYDIMFDNRIKLGEAISTDERFTDFANANKKPLTTVAGFNNVIQLKEVTIKARTYDDDIKPFKSTTCKDWICLNNILNCVNHATGRAPVDGGVYLYNNGRTVIYHGCGAEKVHSVIKNILIPQDFYLPDYDKEPAGAPEFRSTIYWNPNIIVDKTGTTTFSFFTSDIKGDFVIMVQGIEGSMKPLYGTTDFKVE